MESRQVHPRQRHERHEPSDEVQGLQYDVAKPGSVLLAMLPGMGERYLGTYLFDDLNEGSDDEWLASLDK